LALFGMFAAGTIVLLVGRALGLQSRAWSAALRVAMWSVVVGLAGYLFYGLALPGSTFLEGLRPGWRGFLIGFTCGLLPLPFVPLFVRRRRRSHV
jgi:hypothetical protein